MGAMPELDFVIDLALENKGDWIGHTDHPGRYPLLQGRLERVHVRSRYVDDYVKREQALIMEAMKLPEDERGGWLVLEQDKLVAELLLKDWEWYARRGDKASEVEFSPERALEVMTSKQYRPHQTFVRNSISILQSEMERAKKADEKN